MQVTAEKLPRIHWVNSKNISRLSTGLYASANDEHTVIDALVPGWNEGLGRVLVTPMTEEEQKAAVETLTALRDSLEEADLAEEAEEVKINGSKVSISKSEMLRTFNTVYCDKQGRIITPKYRGCTCYRRGNALLKVNTIRLKKGLNPIDMLPISIKEYNNALDEMEDNLIENFHKTYASRGLNDGALVTSCREMFRVGASEAKLEAKVFKGKRGMAQKIFRLCKLDAKHPDLKIIDRIADADDELTSKPFDKEKVQKLLKSNASTEEVKAFIADPSRKNAPKSMSRKDIEHLRDQTPIKLVALVLDVVLKNDAGPLYTASANAEAINKATEGFLS